MFAGCVHASDAFRCFEVDVEELVDHQPDNKGADVRDLCEREIVTASKPMSIVSQRLGVITRRVGSRVSRCRCDGARASSRPDPVGHLQPASASSPRRSRSSLAVTDCRPSDRDAGISMGARRF